MAGKIRKLTSLAIAFTVVCLIAAGLPQFHVVTPLVVLASPDEVTVVPNTKHGNDNTGDSLSGVTGDDATENPDTTSSVDTGDNIYTADKGKSMQFDTFDVSSIPDGSIINAVVLHLQYGALNGYTGTNPVNYDNGGGLTTTGITPTDRTGWSADLAFDLYAAGVDTKSEIQNVDIEFDNNDPKSPSAVHFDYVWITVDYTLSRSVNQGITISDGVTTTVVAGRDASQGITVSDGVTAAFVAGRDASQGITISDGVTAITGAISPVSQGITVSDGVTATVTTTPTPPPPGGGGGGAPPPPPAPPLPPGTIDVSGFVSADGTFTETVVIESVDGECELTINEGTTGLSGEGDPLVEIAVTEMQYPPAPPENSHIIGLTYDLGPEGATFDPAITLTWSYDPDTLPEGVTEENMVLAYYDKDAGEWVELPSTVDTVNRTITASVSHFTTFAIIARAVPPEPATFSLSNLSIQPAEVQPKEAVTITVLVANTGGIEGSYTVELEIEGVKETEKKVTVAAGDSRSVSFTVSREDAGSYSVVVGELSGSFTLVALPAPPVAPALNWPLLGGAVAAVWGLLSFLGSRRISPMVSAALPKLRALVALLVAVRLKTAPFIRRIISSLACTAWPKFRAFVALLVAVRLKIAPFIRHIISSLISRVKH